MIYGPILWNKVGVTLFGMNRVWNVTKVIAVSCMCFALVIGCGGSDMMIRSLIWRTYLMWMIQRCARSSFCKH